MFHHSVKANSIRHIIKDHGINGLADRSMSNVEDIARMGYVLRNFDDMELLNAASKEYRDKNQRPAKMVKLSKRIDGTYYVVEAVPDTNAKRLAVVSAYIKKAPVQQTENVQAPSSNVRNDSVDTEASNNIVSRENNIVNNSVRGDAKNDTHAVDNAQSIRRAISSIRKGESVSLEYVRNVVDALLTNRGEAIKAELSKLIEGEYDKYIPSNERYTESTTKLAYGLGQTRLARDLDISPKKIDHLISSYTGILGQVNKALSPMNDSRRDTSLGLRNKFISDSNYSTDVLNRMYENQEKAERAFNYSGSVGDAVEYENNNIITSYISGMNKAVKALPEEDQRTGRAYLLKSLNSWNYSNTASQEEMLRRLDGETVSERCVITGVPKSTIIWTKDKVKYSYQMTPQEYDEYVKDYLKLIEKYRAYQSKNNKNTADYTDALSKADTEVKKVLSKKYQQKYADKAVKEAKK